MLPPAVGEKSWLALLMHFPAHFIAAPLVILAMWWLGGKLAVPSIVSTRIASGAVSNFPPWADTANGGTTPFRVEACLRAWTELRNTGPGLEQRWQGLQLFRHWARVDADRALLQLRTESGEIPSVTIWPEGEALRQFLMILATLDPDKAWRLALESHDPAMLDAVATELASRRPTEVLASTADSDVKLLALASAAVPMGYIYDATEEVQRVQMHRLLTQRLTSQLIDTADKIIGGSEEQENVLRWRKILAGRLMERPPGEVITCLLGGEVNYLRGELAQRLVASLSDAELKLVLSRKWQDGKSIAALAFNEWPQTDLSRQLKTGSLLTILKLFLPSVGTAHSENDGMLRQAATELLRRDPASLLAVLRSLPPRPPQGNEMPDPFSGKILFYGSPDGPELSTGNAATAKELLSNSPVRFRPALINSLLPLLTEFDPGFAADQIAYLRSNKLDPGDTSYDTHFLFSFWLDADPIAAGQWLHRNPEQLARLGMRDVFQRWVSINPEACSKWMNTLPPGELKEAAIMGVITEMKHRDPAGAIAWAGQSGDSENGRVAQMNILSDWARVAPEAAAAAKAKLTTEP